MAKLNLSSQVSAQVAELFNKALTTKSATSMIGLRITVDPTEIIPVTIKDSQTAALLGWTIPGQEAKEIWSSWLTRRGTSPNTGEVFSNRFIIDGEPKVLAPQDVMSTIFSNDLLLENVTYHIVVEATFSSDGRRTGEKEVRRPFFTWRVLPRREIPAKEYWSQEITSKLVEGEPEEKDSQDQEQEPEKASPKSSKPRKTSTKKAATTAATDDDTSDDVPF